MCLFPLSAVIGHNSWLNMLVYDPNNEPPTPAHTPTPEPLPVTPPPPPTPKQRTPTPAPERSVDVWETSDIC